MINIQTLVFCIFSYAAVMFLIAFFVDKKVTQNPQSKIVNNSFVYCLSLAVYCTSWTFYGSVGKASNSGLLFLTIYLGSTLMVLFWGILLKRLVKIKEGLHVTSIVDFVSARYDKSVSIGVVGALVVVLATIPYLALQFKALISTFMTIVKVDGSISLVDMKFYVAIGFALIMSVFTILFGIRKLDPTERHPGMIFVLAVECLFKLFVFIVVGIFSCYVINDGYFSVLDQLTEVVSKDYSFMGKNSGSVTTWITYMILSASAIIFLPRQFHVAVIENSNTEHIENTIWGFPLYLFLINLFVIPVSIVGLSLGGVGGADRFVLTIPFTHGYVNLTLLTFLGGFAAASGMIMISTMTVTTIITNHLYLPLISKVESGTFLTRTILPFRWLTATCLIVLAVIYVFVAGEDVALVSMGMVSFAGALQFAPIIIGALFWRKANKNGALVGIALGALVWFYTLYLPAFIKSGYFGSDLLKNGLLGISMLKPESLFGLEGIDPLSHAVFWSMFFNVGSFLGISLLSTRGVSEDQIANDFAEAFNDEDLIEIEDENIKTNIDMKKKKRILRSILNRYYDKEKAEEIFLKVLRKVGVDNKDRIGIVKLFELSQEFEKRLTGVIGAAMAHRAVVQAGLLTKREKDELYNYYSESLAEYRISPKELHTRISFYKEKEEIMNNQFKELESLISIRTQELQTKNSQLYESLKRIEEMQDQLVSQEKMASLGLLASGIAHEIKNPLNFINNGAELINKSIDTILNDEGTSLVEKKEFQNILFSSDLIKKHGIRVDKIISKMQTLSESSSDYESTNVKYFYEAICKREVEKLKNLYDLDIEVKWDLSDVGELLISHSAIGQVLSIVIDNALYELSLSKKEKEILFRCYIEKGFVVLEVSDNGMGIPYEILKDIFEPFVTTKQSEIGSGLGLCIANDIMRSHVGDILIDSKVGEYTIVKVRLPNN